MSKNNIEGYTIVINSDDSDSEDVCPSPLSTDEGQPSQFKSKLTETENAVRLSTHPHDQTKGDEESMSSNSSVPISLLEHRTSRTEPETSNDETSEMDADDVQCSSLKDDDTCPSNINLSDHTYHRCPSLKVCEPYQPPGLQMTYFCYFCNFISYESENSVKNHVLHQHPGKNLMYLAQPEKELQALKFKWDLVFKKKSCLVYDGNISDFSEMLMERLDEHESSDKHDKDVENESVHRHADLMEYGISIDSPSESRSESASGPLVQNVYFLTELQRPKDPEQFSCLICNHKSTKFYIIIRHIVETHPNHRSLFCCLERHCKYFAVKEKAFLNHLRLKHNIFSNINTERCVVGVDSRKLVISSQNTKDKLAVFDESDGESLPDNSFYYKCKLCENFESRLEHRMKAHIDECHQDFINTYFCKICTIKRRNFESMKKHVRAFHLDDFYKCAKCNYLNRTYVSVQNHYSSNHLHNGMDAVTVKIRVVPAKEEDLFMFKGADYHDYFSLTASPYPHPPKHM